MINSVNYNKKKSSFDKFQKEFLSCVNEDNFIFKDDLNENKFIIQKETKSINIFSKNQFTKNSQLYLEQEKIIKKKKVQADIIPLMYKFIHKLKKKTYETKNLPKIPKIYEILDDNSLTKKDKYKVKKNKKKIFLNKKKTVSYFK